jgi:type VI secretion system secreted protein Hcp
VAVRFFLRIDDIKGESKDAKHKDEIEVESYSWGVTQSGSVDPGAGGGAGKAQFSDFSFTMPQSVASPVLMLACASGKHLKEAVLTVSASDKVGTDHLKIKFHDLIISSYHVGASSGDDAVRESVSFTYSKMEMEYRPRTAKGELGSPVTAGWDLKSGKGG